MSDILRKLLIEEEGWRNKVYKDSKGIETVGVGRNLRDRGLSDQEVDMLLSNDMASVQSEAETLPGFASLNDVRRAVVCAMVFQMGIAGVRKFPAMLRALEAHDYSHAADQMLDSKWAREDSPARARRAARMMLSGEWEQRR